MFDSLRDAFRQAVDNFWTELNREDPVDDVTSTVEEMQIELERASDRVRALAAEMDGIRAQVAREDEQARVCRRRQEMAMRIGDRETAEVAGEFADRHLRRARILTEKLSVVALEFEDYERERVEMHDQFRRLGDSDAAAARNLRGTGGSPSEAEHGPKPPA